MVGGRIGLYREIAADAPDYYDPTRSAATVCVRRNRTVNNHFEIRQWIAVEIVCIRRNAGVRCVAVAETGGPAAPTRGKVKTLRERRNCRNSEKNCNNKTTVNHCWRPISWAVLIISANNASKQVRTKENDQSGTVGTGTIKSKTTFDASEYDFSGLKAMRDFGKRLVNRLPIPAEALL